MTPSRKTAILLLLTLGLAGCGGGGAVVDDDPPQEGGGGGGGTSPPDDSLGGTTDTAVAVRVVELANSGDLVDIVPGEFDGTTDVISLDSLELSIDSASALSEGRFYSAALEDGSSYRLVYVPTEFSEIPTTGQSVFDGAASILVTLTDAGDANGTYNGIMDARIVADFDNPTGSSLFLDNLSEATFSSAAAPTDGTMPYTPTGGESVSIIGLEDNQTGLVSGTDTSASLADFGETGISAAATASQIELEAGFAGPDASEIAGGVRIDGDEADLRIEFTGAQ